MQPINLYNNVQWFNITMFIGGLLAGLVAAGTFATKEANREPHQIYIMYIFFGVALQNLSWVAVYYICPWEMQTYWIRLFNYAADDPSVMPTASLTMAKGLLGVFVFGSEISNWMLLNLSIDLVLKLKWPDFDYGYFQHVSNFLGYVYAFVCIYLICITGKFE